MGGPWFVRLLLDTHIWLWSMLEPERLSQSVRRVLEDTRNEFWLSPISTWELVNLVDRGRVVLDRAVETWVSDIMQRVPFREAPLTHEVALETRHIVLPHRDPADRFLAATAKVFDLILVTSDKRLIAARKVHTLANR
jgi:PIN domain nuclease of toxin-antitoxin system